MILPFSLSLTSLLASLAYFICFAHRPVRNQLIPSFFFQTASSLSFFLVEGRFFPVRQSLPFLSDDFTLHSPPSLLRVTFLPIFLTLLVFALVGIQMCGKNKHCTHVWRHAQTRFEETKLGVIFLFSQKASPWLVYAQLMAVWNSHLRLCVCLRHSRGVTLVLAAFTAAISAFYIARPHRYPGGRWGGCKLYTLTLAATLSYSPRKPSRSPQNYGGVWLPPEGGGEGTSRKGNPWEEATVDTHVELPRGN